MTPQSTLYFISYRTGDQITGGEKCNAALLEAARLAGMSVVEWEGRRVGSNIFAANFSYLFKSLCINKPCCILLDLDYCTRFLLGLLLTKHISRVPVIGTLYHYKFPYKKPILARTILKAIEAFSSRSLTAVITISKYSQSSFASITSPRNIRSSVIPPFVKDSPADKPLEHEFRIANSMRLLSVGTVEPRKNIHLIVESLRFLSLPFHLDIAGHIQSEAYYHSLLSRIDDLGVSKSCTFHGYLQKTRLDALYVASDIFVLVSEMEGYGIVYAEAMKFGLPIVASRHGAIPELVIHDENGFICTTDNPRDIADAINSLANRNAWIRISQNNLMKFETLSDRATYIAQAKGLFVELGNRLSFPLRT
jgi:glycosyltransferase involved in cell wall biosynthesis